MNKYSSKLTLQLIKRRQEMILKSSEEAKQLGAAEILHKGNDWKTSISQKSA